MALTLPQDNLKASAPALVTPVDLQPALDRLHNAFREGFVTADDIKKRTELGNSEAVAQRKENEARGAKAEQDRKDQEGGKGYTKPGLFSRLTGIGTGPKIPKPAATPAPASPVNPNAGSTEGGEEPMTIPQPFTQAAQSANDFNPSHESTDDLLNLVGEAGYFLP